MGRGGSQAASTGKAAVRTGQTAGGTSDGGESRGRRRTTAPHLRGVSQGGPSLKHLPMPPRGRHTARHEGVSKPGGWLHLAFHIVLASQ